LPPLTKILAPPLHVHMVNKFKFVKKKLNFENITLFGDKLARDFAIYSLILKFTNYFYF
jgi:hypothetical protein